MSVCIATDSNSGINWEESRALGVYVLPMPFYLDEKIFYEELDLNQNQFYKKLEEDVDIKTSMPIAGDLIEFWEKLLKKFDEVVYIPMSSGLSGSCNAAMLLAEEYDGRVQVVDNKRISVTMRQSVIDARELADTGMDAVSIKERLEASALDASIYIMVDTLKYLKKGGRLTPAAAAIGGALHLKPVLQIQGEKLDRFALARTAKLGRNAMIEAVKKDMGERFGAGVKLHVAYTHNPEEAKDFLLEAEEKLGKKIEVMSPLSLSVACHIGPGALALAVTKKLSV